MTIYRPTMTTERRPIEALHDDGTWYPGWLRTSFRQSDGWHGVVEYRAPGDDRCAGILPPPVNRDSLGTYLRGYPAHRIRRRTRT